MCSLQAGAVHDDDYDEGDGGGDVGDGDGAHSQQVLYNLGHITLNIIMVPHNLGRILFVITKGTKTEGGNNHRHHLHVSNLPDYQLNTPQ